MAISLRFVCDTCGLSVEGWDDGNPYVEYPSGKRRYCYHPSGDEDMRLVAMKALEKVETREEIKTFLKRLVRLQTHMENESVSGRLCLDCGRITLITASHPDKDKTVCSQCKSANVYDTPKEIEAYLKTHTGNASDHLCLDCGHISRLDENRDKMVCRKCKSPNVYDTFDLAGLKCPKCNGTFSKGTFCAIS